jgi:5-methylcytosine-specific restriction endonuclease McrA
MSSVKKKTAAEKQVEMLATLNKDRDAREKGYRARALKMYPHICGSCSREFSGARLKELTVHHKNHDHEYNPVDGSNWELLCVYCHDNEHEKHKLKGRGSSGSAVDPLAGNKGFSAFDGLDALFGGD